jgi:hypothetical protein
MSLPIAPEQMEVYRATARRRCEEGRESSRRRRERAREAARYAAGLLREQFGAGRVVVSAPLWAGDPSPSGRISTLRLGVCRLTIILLR